MKKITILFLLNVATVHVNAADFRGKEFGDMCRTVDDTDVYSLERKLGSREVTFLKKSGHDEYIFLEKHDELMTQIIYSCTKSGKLYSGAFRYVFGTYKDAQNFAESKIKALKDKAGAPKIIHVLDSKIQDINENFVIDAVSKIEKENGTPVERKQLEEIEKQKSKLIDLMKSVFNSEDYHALWVEKDYALKIKVTSGKSPSVSLEKIFDPIDPIGSH